MSCEPCDNSCDNTNPPMSGTKISQLNTLDVIESNDLLVVVDVSNNETKNVEFSTIVYYDNSGTSLSGDNYQDVITELDDKINSVSGISNIHNELSGLQGGGLSGDFYHLDELGYDTINNLTSGYGTVPSGGLDGQVLAKHSDNDWDYIWQSISGSGGGLPDVPDNNTYLRTYGNWVQSDQFTSSAYYNISETNNLLNDKEDYLGTPLLDGQVLASSGTDERYWVSIGGGNGQLVKITEVNTGYTLKDDNRDNKGDIGHDAIDLSFSETQSTNLGATGNWSYAEGYETMASADYSHAEGNNTSASGYFSHAEGRMTNASGYFSHAEGNYNNASGSASHTEGSETVSSGDYSHAEGQNTIASGQRSHAEGYETVASGFNSHAEGEATLASTNFTHSEGHYTSATAFASHAEGDFTLASGSKSHAEGGYTVASGYASHAEGRLTNATGDYTHAEGVYNKAMGDYTHAEGYYTQANGENSHSGGNNSIANGKYSRVNGLQSLAGKTIDVIIDGSNPKIITLSYTIDRQDLIDVYIPTVINGEMMTKRVTAVSFDSVNDILTITFELDVTGITQIAIDVDKIEGAVADGNNCIASGDWARAEGQNTQSIGSNSYAGGYATIAQSDNSVAQGMYNDPKTEDMYEFGVGVDDNNRANAFEITSAGILSAPQQNGNIINDDHLVTKKYVDDLNYRGFSVNSVSFVYAGGVNNSIILEKHSAYSGRSGYKIPNSNYVTKIQSINFYAATSFHNGSDDMKASLRLSEFDANNTSMYTFGLGDEKLLVDDMFENTINTGYKYSFADNVVLNDSIELTPNKILMCEFYPNFWTFSDIEINIIFSIEKVS